MRPFTIFTFAVLEAGLAMLLAVGVVTSHGRTLGDYALAWISGLALLSGAGAVSDETSEVEYDPDKVDLFVEPGSKTTVPNNPVYSFLGAPGSDVWIVPQVINPNLLTVGLSAEDMPTGFFVNDAFELRITGVSGPGAFALFQSDAFGVPHVFANTRDGLDAHDKVPMFAGFHGHFNWAFSTAGKYDVTFEAVGTLLDGTVVSSGPRTVTFSVSHRSRPFKAEL